jgi:TolB protein
VTPTNTPRITIQPVTLTITVSPIPEETVITTTPRSPNQLLQLTFVSDHNGVYAMEVNCLETTEPCLGEPNLLFEWDNWVSEIDWSPDGKRIAFISGQYGGTLFIADWNGENAIQITSICGATHSPQWSPDGSKIAYIFLPGEQDCEYLDLPIIEIYDQETNQTTSIYSSAYAPERIYWLPGGEFAYITMNSETDRIEMINIVKTDGTLIEQLPSNAGEYNHILGLTFSPDGLQLAFVGDIWPPTGRTTDDIYVTSRAESDIINLTNGSGHNFGPVWFPTGNWIEFESDRNGDYEIYLIKSDGTGLLQITRDLASDTYPAWRVIP